LLPRWRLLRFDAGDLKHIPVDQVYK